MNVPTLQPKSYRNRRRLTVPVYMVFRPALCARPLSHDGLKSARTTTGRGGTGDRASPSRWVVYTRFAFEIYNSGNAGAHEAAARTRASRNRMHLFSLRSFRLEFSLTFWLRINNKLQRKYWTPTCIKVTLRTGIYSMFALDSRSQRLY